MVRPMDIDPKLLRNATLYFPTEDIDDPDPFTADTLERLLSQRPRTEEDAKREYVAETRDDPSRMREDGVVVTNAWETIQVGHRVRYALQSDLDTKPFELPRVGVVIEVDSGSDSAVIRESPGRFLHRVRLHNVIRLS